MDQQGAPRLTRIAISMPTPIMLMNVMPEVMNAPITMAVVPSSHDRPPVRR